MHLAQSQRAWHDPCLILRAGGQLMKLKLPSRRRALRWIAILIVVAIILVYILLPVGFGIVAVFPYKESVGAPPDGFQEVTLTTQDKVKLAAWYKAPENGAAIILVHGGGGTRDDVRGHAALLADHGYGVLALDLRGQGKSGGTTNRFGWQGTRDIGAAVDYLHTREEVVAIGGWGLSLGGEALLGAASQYPAMAAIVADGATQRSVGELRALPSERSLVRNWVQRVMYATVQVLSGDDPPKPLLESMVEAESTAFLLIAGGREDLEVKFNELFADTVGERTTLWIAPGASHTGAFDRYRDEYEQRLFEFFEATLSGESVAAN
jgi:pimeloyl-ACP methyl ester carboxylesterase